MSETRPRILIAGGAGFLGSHLCDHYIASHTVVCVDNLSTGRLKNIQHLMSNEAFVFVQSDICLPLPETVTNLPYDIVANLASPASPPGYQRLALETLKVGAIGTWNLLELAYTNKARFFHASTSEVYGDPTVHPQPETYFGNVNSYGPRSMYDESKRYAEALIYSFRKTYPLSSAIVRIFNTYGPRMDPQDGRVVSNFIVQALVGEPITIYGDGSQTRSFCYVSDLINGFVKLIESDLEGPINLGNPIEFTMNQLADLVIEQTGSSFGRVKKPLPQDDPTQRQPDITLAKAKLGFEPTVPLAAGLTKTIAYFKAELNNTGGLQ